MPEPIVNPAPAAPAAAPTPAPAAAPKAEDIATSLLAALENRTQRVEKSVAKSFSEQYGLSHTPLAGNDRQYRTPYQATRNFNPRSPCGERRHTTTPRTTRKISIHAPLAGSDGPCYIHTAARSDFNPRSPCGERRLLEVFNRASQRFQSTLPLRGATGRRS